MKKKLFGAVVAPISILGLTFALGLGSSAFGTPAGDEQQTDADTLINTLNVTTDIPVAPWCGWYVSGGADGNLTLVPADGAPTTYTGAEIALTATAEANTAYVGPSAGLTSEGEDADCSWFTEMNKYGARYDVESSGYQFTAATISGQDDDEMDFEADDSNPLTITNTGIEDCLAEGFTTNPTAEIKQTNTKTTPWTVLTLDVNNTNFCQWSAKYEIKIPLGMSPTYGNVTYRWTGPTLTHTLVIPETQP